MLSPSALGLRVSQYDQKFKARSNRSVAYFRGQVHSAADSPMHAWHPPFASAQRGILFRTSVLSTIELGLRRNSKNAVERTSDSASCALSELLLPFGLEPRCPSLQLRVCTPTHVRAPSHNVLLSATMRACRRVGSYACVCTQV